MPAYPQNPARHHADGAGRESQENTKALQVLVISQLELCILIEDAGKKSYEELQQ